MNVFCSSSFSPQLWLHPKSQHELNIEHYQAVLCIDSRGCLTIEEEPSTPMVDAAESDIDVLDKKKDNKENECKSDAVDAICTSPVRVAVFAKRVCESPQKRKSFRVCGTPLADSTFCTLKLGHLCAHEGCESSMGYRPRHGVDRYGSYEKCARLV